MEPPDDSTGLARLFHEAAHGYNEDNGALLDLIIRTLPADRVQTAAAAVRGLTRATAAIEPAECGPPYINYLDALHTGHMPALQWYWHNAGPGGIEIKQAYQCYPALDTVSAILAINGNLPALQIARTYGCQWDENTCACAAFEGHLEVLQWLHAQGCPWDEQSTRYAARNGHLSTLQWLREQDPPCPWSNTLCDDAARYGQYEVLAWARAQMPPAPLSIYARDEAARKGNLTFQQHPQDQTPRCGNDWYDI